MTDKLPGFDDPSIKPMEAAKAAHAWVSQFQSALDSKDADKITNLFTDDGWWRDMLTIDAVDFNSYRSKHLRQAEDSGDSANTESNSQSNRLKRV